MGYFNNIRFSTTQILFTSLGLKRKLLDGINLHKPDFYLGFTPWSVGDGYFDYLLRFMIPLCVGTATKYIYMTYTYKYKYSLRDDIFYCKKTDQSA